jgi:hypothetical protein
VSAVAVAKQHPAESSPTPTRSTRPLVNSTVAFCLALMVMVTLHELAHAVAALALGLHPVVHLGSVDTGALTAAQKATTNAVGPLFSLVSGLLLLALPHRGTPFVRLFVLWLGLLSVQELNGYLMTGPFVSEGDVGVVLRETGSPVWVGLVGLVVGVLGTVWAGRIATARLLAMVDPAGDVGGQLRRLGLFAWLLGALLSLVLSLGALDPGWIGLFELAGAVSVGLFLLFVRYFMGRLDVAGAALRFGWPWLGVACLLVVAVLRQLVFGPGLAL